MIALIHAAHIFLVVLCLPFLIEAVFGLDLGRGGQTYVPLAALRPSPVSPGLPSRPGVGAGLGLLLRFPAPWLIGPMLASAALHATGLSGFILPTIPLSIAQLVIGASRRLPFRGRFP